MNNSKKYLSLLAVAILILVTGLSAADTTKAQTVSSPATPEEAGESATVQSSQNTSQTVSNVDPDNDGDVDTAQAVPRQVVPSSIFNSPISQWIVLSGLFGGNAFGGYGYPYNGNTGGIFNNPVSQWIVLSDLFGGQNPFGTYYNPY